MPSRPDIRELAANVKEAFGDMDRETLLEILTFVVKEYVVEGPPPMLVHQAETLSDLQGASFAQLIAAMQTRFDHAELQLFTVDGNNVSVRINGVMQPVVAGAPGSAARPPAADLPRPAAGVHVVETTLSRPPVPQGFIDTRPNAAPPPPAQQPQQPAAPPPSRGLSLSGRPTGGGNAPAPAPAAPQGQPAAPAAAPAAAAPPAGESKPDASGGDDASARFSLLELD
jgi:hypothetical protein